MAKDAQGNIVPNPRFATDAKFLEKAGLSSSLPSGSTPAPSLTEPEPAPPVNPPAQPPADPPAPAVEPAPEPAPVVPPVEGEPPAPPAEPIPAPEEVDPNDLSIELPGAAGVVSPEPGQPEEIVRLEGSPLPENAPEWQVKAYNALMNDQDLTPEERSDIAATRPGAYTRLRNAQKNAKVLGKYRDANVPIGEVVTLLEKQDTTRFRELENHAVAAILSDETKAKAFAEAKPEEYSRLIIALVEEQPAFVSRVLEKRGLKVVEAKPINVDELMAEFEANPLVESMKGTDAGDALIASTRARFEESAQLANIKPELDPKALADELQHTSTPVDLESVQLKMQMVTDVRNKVWLPAVEDGLKASGIKPATEEEKKTNPQAAALKNLIYGVALHGLPGVLPDWDEQSYTFAQEQDGIKDVFASLQDLTERNALDEFKATAPVLNEFYFQFGQRRAGIRFIKNLYDAVSKMTTNGTPLPPPSPDPVVPGTAGPGAAPPVAVAAKSGFVSDQRWLDQVANQK